MSGLAATLRLDVQVQARSQLYGIGIGVAVAVGLIARFLVGAEHAAVGAPILYLLALGGTTYIFGASMVLVEKSQGTLAALRVSPLRRDTYFLSKLITLTAFAAVEGAIIHAVGFWGTGFSLLPLGAGVLGLGLFNTLVGLAHVASHDSMFSFLVPGAMLIGSILQWPFLYALDIGPPWVWYLFPTQGPLLLMLGAFEPLAAWQWGYALAMTVGSTLAVGWLARRRFAEHVGLL